MFKSSRHAVWFVCALVAWIVGAEAQETNIDSSLVGCWQQTRHTNEEICLFREGNFALYIVTSDGENDDTMIVEGDYILSGDRVILFGNSDADVGWFPDGREMACRFALDGVTAVRLDDCRLAGSWIRNLDND